MQRLQQLIENLDTAANDAFKVQELKSYSSLIPPEDAAWALFFFENRRLKTKTGLKLLKEIISSFSIGSREMALVIHKYKNHARFVGLRQ